MAAVATQGCVQATPSSGLVYSGGTANSGAWTVSPSSPLQESVDAMLTVSGVAVVHAASCGFLFTGMLGNTAVTDSVSVDLQPTETRLHSGGVAVLLDGDTAHDANGFGNTLTVVVPAATPSLEVG